MLMLNISLFFELLRSGPARVRSGLTRSRQWRPSRTNAAGALWLGAESLALSMGMSHDYEAALAAGATHVRVGSTIFGARTPKPAATTTTAPADVAASAIAAVSLG